MFRLFSLQRKAEVSFTLNDLICLNKNYGNGHHPRATNSLPSRFYKISNPNPSKGVQAVVC